jgi:hypothetical protein
MDLYNVSTRKLEPIDNPEELQKAVLAGTHSFAQGSEVTVKAPDGTLGSIPSSNVVEALKAGYQIETPTQRAVREYVDENKGLKGSAKVALGQFADEALFGLPELIFDKTRDPLEVAKKEALKKEHELSNLAGGVGGFAANMLVGGPLYKGAAKVNEAITKRVADKIGTVAAGEVGSRTLSNIAKEIVAKTGGGIAEGALISAPHALTEAALGDPGEAGETLLAGGLIGGFLGGGLGVAKEIFNLGTAGVKKGASLVTQQKETADSLVRKAAQVFTGVDEDAIKHYVDNFERVNQAPTIEALKDDIDDIVLKAKERVEVAKTLEASAKQDLDLAYREKTRELAQERAPLSLASEMTEALEAQKGVIGELSSQADEVLAKSGVIFNKEDVLGLLDRVSGGLGAGKERALIGDEAISAAAKIGTIKERIAAGLGDTIDGVTMRDVLRQVRKDINYNQLSGEFNDTLNKVRKDFTTGVSDLLKGQVPEYKAIMEKMAPLSQTLEDMAKKFGSPERALTSINQIVGKKSEVKAGMLEKFSELTGVNWREKLADLQKTKDSLEKIRRGQDLRADLFPELVQKLERSAEEVMKAQAAFEPIRRLTREQTQAAIKNQFGKNVSIENRRAFEALSEAAGRDFLTQMKDRAVLDAFSKDYTRGSKRTNLLGSIGATIGSAVAGTPGAFVGTSIGGLVGSALDTSGGQLLKKMIDTNKSVSGLLFSEQAMKRAAEQMDAIPSILKRMSDKKPAPFKTMSNTALIRVLESHKKNDKPKELPVSERLEKLKELNNKTSQWAGNPQGLSAEIAALTSNISNNGAPEIGAALNQKMLLAVNYLHAAMPRPPKPKSTFAKELIWKPSMAELSAYEQKLDIVENPFHVLKELELGTLTRNHMEALKTVYPGIHRMIVGKIAEAAMNQESHLSYAQRSKLGLIIGEPLDDSTTPRSVAYYQETFTAPDQTQSESPQPSQQGAVKGKINIAEGMQTNTQRIASRS